MERESTNFLCFIIFTRLREIHAKNRVLLLRICKVNCDWSLTADVTEIFSRLGFADGFSRRVQTRGEKTGCSRRLEVTVCIYKGEEKPSERQFEAAIYTKELLLPFHFHNSQVMYTVDVNGILTEISSPTLEVGIRDI